MHYVDLPSPPYAMLPSLVSRVDVDVIGRHYFDSLRRQYKLPTSSAPSNHYRTTCRRRRSISGRGPYRHVDNASKGIGNLFSTP